MQKCYAVTATGAPCRSAAQKGSDFCFFHNPTQATKRAQARKKGGYNRHTQHFADASQLPASVTTLADANKILSYVLVEVIGQENTIARARVLLNLFDSYIKSFEIGELEKRIQALETISK